MNIRSKIFGGGSEEPQSPLVDSKAPKGAKADMLHTISVPREEHRRGNTRGGDRHRLPLEKVRVIHDGKDHEVQLVNLSGGGAMVEGDFSPMLWDRVDLQLAEDGVIECAVRWLKGNRVGLEFAHETRLGCSTDEQAALLREVVARSFPDVELKDPDGAAPPPRQPEPEPGSEHRVERRHPLIWSGVLHHDFQTIPVRLRNISSSGALIDCEALLRVGAEPLLDLGEAGNIFATVTWKVGDQAGLRFHSPFDMTQLAKAKPDVAPTRWKRPAYLKSSEPAGSPWAEEWSRMSVSDLREELEGFLKR